MLQEEIPESDRFAALPTAMLARQLAAREREERTQALQKHLETSKAYAERIGSEERAGSKRRSAAQRQSEAEEASTCRILSAQEAARREAEQRRHDGALAAAVSAHKAESLREQKNVERIIAGSEELRELEARLRAAYVNKERHVQLAESAAMAAETDAREAQIAGAMEAERQRGLQAEAYREFLRLEDGKLIKVGLDAQIKDKERLKAEAYQEFLKEKEQVDEVVRKIAAEEAAEAAAREAKEAETRRYIDEFISQRERFKAERVAELERENDEIRRYAAAVMQREIEQRAAAETSQNARDAAFEAITKGMAAESAKRLEEEQLRNELLEAEAEEEAARREADAKERALRQRLDIALANEYQRELKRLAREEEKKAEDALRTSMLERFAAEDRIDQMNAQKRRMKQLEHRREVERLLEQRREAFEAARAAEVEAAMGDGKADRHPPLPPPGRRLRARALSAPICRIPPPSLVHAPCDRPRRRG